MQGIANLVFACRMTDTPEKRRIYDDVAARGDLWLQLVEARQAAGQSQRELAGRLGISQAQVVRLDRRGNESYSLNSIRRYVTALGHGFSLDVVVRKPNVREKEPEPQLVAP